MADKQKKLRSYAKGRFTRSVNAFRRSIEENIDVETLKLLAGDVESTWKDVEKNIKNILVHWKTMPRKQRMYGLERRLC